MADEVNMKYNFLSDEEPTDEQLEQLMKEVAVEARKKKEEALKKYKDAMRLEIHFRAKKKQVREKDDEKA